MAFEPHLQPEPKRNMNNPTLTATLPASDECVLDRIDTLDQISAAELAELDEFFAHLEEQAWLDSLDEKAMVWGNATAAWN